MVECEAQLKLYTIDFHRYKTAVMRYGFTGKLNGKIFEHVLEELGLKLDFDDVQSPMYLLLHNREMLDQDGWFLVNRLIVLGLMNC